MKTPELKYGNLGAVIAQANFADNSITLNRELWPVLPKRLRDFVICHEVTHLADRITDEAETNRRASARYIAAANSPAERAARQAYVSELAGINYSIDSLAAVASGAMRSQLVGAVILLVIYLIIKIL